MFSYYGAKSKIITKYPEPQFPVIIEPFAGSARYSLLYPDYKIILNDIYKVIYDIWKYLISAEKEQITNLLKDLKQGTDINWIEGITRVEKYLLGLIINRGSESPKNIVTRWTIEKKEIQRHRERILTYLPQIRHWQIYNKDFTELENIEATWFIDPPYQYGGHRYIHNAIDYNELGDWCLSRKGQIIVCESLGADWLPFVPLVELYGQKHNTTEVIYTS